MRLYEIAKEMQEVLMLLESEEQVDNETLIQYMDQLEQDMEQKIDNIACLFKNEQAITGAIDEEIKKLTERKKRHENKATWLKEYLSSFMGAMGLKTFENGRIKISFRPSESVSVDEKLFRERYPQYVQAVTVESIPSKPEIKKLITAGIVTDGAEIVKKQNIQIK